MRDKKLVCKEISKFQRSIPCNTSQYRILNVKSRKVEINDKQNSQRLTTKTRWQARVNPFEKKAASKIRSLGTWDCFSSGEISFSFHRALPPISIHFVRLSAAPFVLSGAYTFPLPPPPAILLPYHPSPSWPALEASLPNPLLYFYRWRPRKRSIRLSVS